MDYIRQFKKTTVNSFFGNFLYEQVIPNNHFLVKLKNEIHWNEFLPQLLPYYKGELSIGNKPFNPLVILKMLFLSTLYKLSEREVEDFANYNLPAKYFLDLGVDQSAPDHATLTVFKNRIMANAGVLPFEQIFTKIIKIALDKGIKFGDVQVIDSSHIPANVNLIKDKIRQKSENKPPRDKSAKLGVKHLKEAKTKDNKKVMVKDEFYGYKTHTSFNPQTGITTSIKTTPGNVYDGDYLVPLVKQDKQKGVDADIYSADKGYDDGDNHVFLQTNDIGDAICLKDNRTTTKSIDNNNFWQKVKDKPEYQYGLNQRPEIEKCYGDSKVKHGLNRCRYLGLMRTSFQCYLTFAAMNLKRIIKITTGVRFKNEQYSYAYI